MVELAEVPIYACNVDVHDMYISTNGRDKDDTKSQSEWASPLEVLVTGSTGSGEAETTHHTSCVQSCTTNQGTCKRGGGQTVVSIHVHCMFLLMLH